MRITKKRLQLTEEHLKMKHEAEMAARKARVENLARGMHWWDKIKLFVKI